MATIISEPHKFYNKYDERGNIIYSNHSNGLEKWMEYDDQNRMIHYKTKNNESYVYEEWYEYKPDNSVLTKKSDNTWEYTEYNEFGSPTLYRNSYSHFKRYEYNDHNKLIHTESDYGDNWYEYDQRDNLVLERNSIGYYKQYEYNDNNQIIRTVNSLGVVEEFKYDSNGNKIYESNSASKLEFYYTYNQKCKLIKMEDNIGRIIKEYDYDDNDRITTIKDNIFLYKYIYNENNKVLEYSREYVKKG